MCPYGPTPNDWKTAEQVNIEAERRDFEEHFRPMFNPDIIPSPDDFKRDASGTGYYYQQTHWMFEAWKAARRAAPSASASDDLPRPFELRSAARMIREQLKSTPATAHWKDCEQAAACDAAASYFERLAIKSAARKED